MQFYKLEGCTTDKQWTNEKKSYTEKKSQNHSLSVKALKYNKAQKDKMYIFVSDITDGIVQIGIIVKENIDIMKQVKTFLKTIQLDLQDITLEEILFTSINNMLGAADRTEFIEDDEEILKYYGLEDLTCRYGRYIHYTENIFYIHNKAKIYTDAARHLMRDSLIPELDRIYKGTTKKGVLGHPVHYMILTNNRDTQKDALALLLQALYINNRIQSRRICKKKLSFYDDEDSLKGLDTLYRSCFGGTIVIEYKGNADVETDQASDIREIIEGVCKMMRNYQNQVLTVLCLFNAGNKDKELFFENLGNINIVELSEAPVSGEQAQDFLKMLAKKQGVKSDKNLLTDIEYGKEYLSSDLWKIYERWQNNKLKTDIYPQYKNILTTEYQVIKTAPKGEAYDELMSMIGLHDAKKVLQQALDYYKIQKLFKEKDLPLSSPTMHMIFTGNPGTAKTTVARLFARIMQKNRLLSKGHLVEVGRSDLVGRYVGWTAPTIKKKFKEAYGGVLFIDEAYSLVDDRDGSYGDEAINTIVQEMENYRDDLIVIFAGYPDKMEWFLQKNPGMRSRIAFHVPFPDYQTDELCQIAELFAKKYEMKLQPNAQNKLRDIFERSRGQEDFGNGRFVRTIIEQTRMTQASRLIQMDVDTLTRKDLTTILEEDIFVPQSTNSESHHIGFMPI